MNNVFEKQQQFFLNNKTKDLNFRKEQLEKFLTVLKENEEKLYEAIYKDFGKSSFETYTTELALIYHEIKLALKKSDGRSQNELEPTLQTFLQKVTPFLNHLLNIRHTLILKNGC